MAENDSKLNCVIKGLPEDLAELHLSGTMLFPNPEDYDQYRWWRIRVLLALAADRHTEGLIRGLSDDEMIQINRQTGEYLGEMLHYYGGWSALGNITVGSSDPGMKKPLVAQTRDKAKTGIVVGYVLVWALEKMVSIGRAAEKICSEIGYAHDEEKISKRQNPDSFRKYTWQKWKFSAHLWAAYVNHHLYEIRHEERWLPLRRHPSGLDGFVDEAEEFLRRASTQFPPNGPRIPILPPESCWQIIR